MMERIATKLDASNEFLAQLYELCKKTLEDINRRHQNSQPTMKIEDYVVIVLIRTAIL